MNHIKVIFTLGMMTTMLSGCISFHSGRLDYIATENLSLDAVNLDALKIDAGAGFIRLTGVDGLQAIKVKADLEVDRDSYRLILEKRGDSAVLIAEPQTNHFGIFFGNPKIDLTIQVPKELMVDIHDGSGFIAVSELNSSLTIDDGSGDIRVQNHGGSLDIDDGSGAIELENIDGALTIDDGSGGIDIVHTRQSIVIDDGSGDLKIEDAVGHVTIDDGSGDLILTNIQNGLTIIDSGSGSVSMNNVKGEINYDDN